jgi:hypothetical protein
MLHKLTTAGKCAAMLVAVGVGIGLMVLVAQAATVTLRTVPDAKKQFTLRVPIAWNVKTPDGNATLTATAPTPTGGLPDSVDVVVHAALSGMTAQSCESEAEWVTQHFAHINFTTLSQGPESVGGYAGYSHAYTWKAPTGQSRWSTQVCIVQLGQVYVSTGTTANTASTLAAHRTLLTTIINSIRIQAHVVPAAQTPSSGPSQTH